MSLPTTHNENRENDWGWREEESAKTQQQPKSHGLDPGRFHRANKPGQATVAAMKTTMRRERITERKRQVMEEQELRRSAFRSATDLKTWHTQKQAFDHFSQLQQQYLQHNNDKPEKLATQGATPNITEIDSESSEYLTSSCSSAQTSSTEGSQAIEAKRQLTNRTQSPAKSTRRQQYYQQFLAEREKKGPLPLDESTRDALWSMEPRIWSIEKSSTGKRKYIVGHTGRLIDRYWRRIGPEQRHYYELIAEGQACRLYLDLEFSKLTNPSIEDEEELLTELLEELSSELQRVFPEQVNRPISRKDVVDLEATTDKKFSRHWIVHLPGSHLFRDTACMGRFVQTWIGNLADAHAIQQLGNTRPLLQKYLFVRPPPSNATSAATAAIADARPCCIVDLGVYTRNRLFRLMGSTKFGKSCQATLRIAKANEFTLTTNGNFGNHMFYRPEMIVTVNSTFENGEPPGELETTTVADTGFEDEIEKAVKGFESSIDWTSHAEALAKTLVVPLNASKMDYPILPFDEVETEVTDANDFRASKILPVAKPRLISSSYSGPSPYPVLDSFVQSVLAMRESLKGAIRAWSIEKDDDGKHLSITYQMSGNRWCECIQRSHKSNNIYWVVDLLLWHCVQRCHDPDCRAMNFRGTPVRLPDNVRESIQQEWIDEELAKLDEAELKLSSDQASAGLNANESFVDEFDGDAEFEAALLALNLGPSVSEEPKELPTAGDDDKKLVKEAQPAQEEEEGLSDLAILNAIEAQPELFP